MSTLANAATADTTITKKTATEWVKSHVWAKKLNLELHPSINSVEFEKQYELNKAEWDKALEFLEKSDLATMAPGMYPIVGKDVYASITDAPSKKFENAKWESHQKYVDLQYVIKGEEKIGVISIDKAIVTEPYNESKDAAHYSGDGEYYLATPKVFFLFFPPDVHRPNILVDGFDTVKKLVIKIRYVQE